MADLVAQLRAAVELKDVAEIQAALAAGADPDAVINAGFTAVHYICWSGRTLACLRALLAAGANLNPALADGVMALHTAAKYGHTQCIRALLAAGANLTAVDVGGWSPLRWAVFSGCVDSATALLEAAPEVAMLRTTCGELPLQVALKSEYFAIARCLLEHGELPPAAESLALLEAARRQAVLPLYAALVARQPLTPAEWARVPSPCPGLGAVLPTVLARSEAEAALLVACLPSADRERLRTAALCITRVQQRRRLSLPAELLRPLLLLAAE